MDMTGVEKRRSPFIWPTWLAGLISGDKQCWWAAWFKAHYTYPKLADDLSKWKAEHNELMLRTADDLRSIGATVTIEDQNKLNVKGRTATIGGKPDIIALWPDGTATVVDAKTGHRRESDYWQVVTYIALLTLPTRISADGKVSQGGRLEDRKVSGILTYKDGDRRISPEDAKADAPRVFGTVATLAADLPPNRVPSESECRFCDISGCPDRVIAVDVTVETEEF